MLCGVPQVLVVQGARWLLDWMRMCVEHCPHAFLHHSQSMEPQNERSFNDVQLGGH